MTRTALRSIILLWLAWSVILIGYMQFARARYAPSRPDTSLIWTENETRRDSLDDKPYLLDPFLNTQVAWDSEFYLSIATVGYEDPAVQMVEERGEGYRMSYAFFPFYPFLMSIVRVPFALLGMPPIAASVLAGVIISLLGTLGAMIALYSIAQPELGDAGGLRTVFMMLIFPTSVFFAAVYTEGLFAGLAFGSLALMMRRRLIAAALLAALATWTRSVGGVLVIPLLLSWWLAYRAADDKRALLMRLPVLLLPLAAYAVWRVRFGVPFDFVNVTWFGNGFLLFEKVEQSWTQLLERAETNPQSAAFVIMGLSGVALAAVSCLVTLRRYPQLAIFGIIVLIISMTSGWNGSNSALRYVLVIPTLWLMLGQWSRNPIFERAWMLLSILLLAMHAFLFSFDFWTS